MKKAKEKYYVFRARCIINADYCGELKFLTHDEIYRKFSIGNPAFLFEFVSDDFNVKTFTDFLKYPLYADKNLKFFEVFFVVEILPDYQNIKIVYFDANRNYNAWKITDIDDDYFSEWNEFSGDEFDELFDRLYLFVDDFLANPKKVKTLEKEYLSKGIV